MLPAAMRAKYEKFIIVDEPERIEDADFKAFLAGRKRIQLKEVDSAELMKTLKRYASQGIVTVDTAVGQQTAVKKVRMIRMADEANTPILYLTPFIPMRKNKPNYFAGCWNMQGQQSVQNN